MTLLHRFEPAKSGILLPGSLKLETGTERYPVNANGMIVIDLKPGDLLEVIDPQGRQPCEIVLFDAKALVNRMRLPFMVLLLSTATFQRFCSYLTRAR